MFKTKFFHKQQLEEVVYRIYDESHCEVNAFALS